MLPVCQVQCQINDGTGAPVADALITATLDRYEVAATSGYVVPRVAQARTGPDGACVLSLWPNALGSTESSYTVRIAPPKGRVLVTRAVVPNTATAELHLIADLPAYEGKSDGELAVDAAIAAAAPAIEARLGAEAAQSESEAARDAAAGHRLVAQNAATESKGARDAALAAQSGAELAAVAAEQQRIAAEAAKDQTGQDLQATAAHHAGSAEDAAAAALSASSAQGAAAIASGAATRATEASDAAELARQAAVEQASLAGSVAGDRKSTRLNSSH